MQTDYQLTFPAEDELLLFAEERYCNKEQKLERLRQTQIKMMETLGITAVADPVGHDPYVLASVLSAMHPEKWTKHDVQGLIEIVFDLQYPTVTESAPDGKTRTVYLKNTDCSHIPYYLKDRNISVRYAEYLKCLGNRPDLFPESAFRKKHYRCEPVLYCIPESERAKEPFSRIIAEAEKYIGYPYVWGGSEPETSFDCSGFVSYVYNNCGIGLNLGRMNSRDLYQICTIVTEEEAVAGDLVFFSGTYNVSGVSHVGIYVGNGKMLHAGDPIQYNDFHSGFFADKLVGFGRIV